MWLVTAYEASGDTGKGDRALRATHPSSPETCPASAKTPAVHHSLEAPKLEYPDEWTVKNPRFGSFR
jgi:hypothetical protein